MKPLSILWISILLLVSAPAECQTSNVITGRGVYFFGPSQLESDSLNEDDATALDDFTNYVGQVVPYLRANNLQTEYLSSRTIVVKYATSKSFLVSRDSVDFGTILTDGIKEPRLLKFVLTDDELRSEVRQYFNLK